MINSVILGFAKRSIASTISIQGHCTSKKMTRIFHIAFTRSDPNQFTQCLSLQLLCLFLVSPTFQTTPYIILLQYHDKINSWAAPAIHMSSKKVNSTTDIISYLSSTTCNPLLYFNSFFFAFYLYLIPLLSLHQFHVFFSLLFCPSFSPN